MPAEALRVVVTGATAGLGYYAAEQMARQGHHVVLAARSHDRAVRAADLVRDRVPGAEVRTVHLDLADLASVEAGASEIAGGGAVDVLLANAGVVGSRRRRRTTDGHELQFGTNHLGHFALVSHLLPALAQAPAARVVHLGSIAHRFVRLDLDDPMMLGHYSGAVAYARSKLAVMTFGFELDRRLREVGSSVRSVVAHPGLSVDPLSDPRPPVVEVRRPPAVLTSAAHVVAQGKEVGAEPLVHASTAAGVEGGEYWGPEGWFQLTGAPARVRARPHAHHRATAADLWSLSARLTSIEPSL